MTNDLGLGKLITTDRQRDAVHVAVVAVAAGEAMSPGDHIGLDKDGVAFITDVGHMGVVDPFLWTTVLKGQRFWLFLYPGTVTGMRHEWSHPAFDGEPDGRIVGYSPRIMGRVETELYDKRCELRAAGELADDMSDEEVRKQISEDWLRDWISKADCPGYDMVIAAVTGQHVDGVQGYGAAYEIQDYGDDDTYLYFAGRDAHGSIPPEFWDHVEIVTGKKCPARPNGFSCSC